MPSLWQRAADRETRGRRAANDVIEEAQHEKKESVAALHDRIDCIESTATPQTYKKTHTRQIMNPTDPGSKPTGSKFPIIINDDIIHLILKKCPLSTQIRAPRHAVRSQSPPAAPRNRVMGVRSERGPAETATPRSGQEPGQSNS